MSLCGHFESHCVLRVFSVILCVLVLTVFLSVFVFLVVYRLFVVMFSFFFLFRFMSLSGCFVSLCSLVTMPRPREIN